LQERVDEWMSSMVWKMREDENQDGTTINVGTSTRKKKKSAAKNGFSINQIFLTL
jgi:uncharacterized protein YeaC (DUF1315 family)